MSDATDNRFYREKTEQVPSKERFKIRQWVQTWLFSGTVRQTVNMEWPGEFIEDVVSMLAAWRTQSAHEPRAGLSAERIGELLSQCIFHAETGNDDSAAFYGDLAAVLRAAQPPAAVENTRVQFIAEAAKRDDTDFRTNAPFYVRDLLLHIHGMIRERKPSQPPSPEPLATVVCEWIERRRKELSKQGITGGHYIADLCLLEEAINNCLSPSLTKSGEQS